MKRAHLLLLVLLIAVLVASTVYAEDGGDSRPRVSYLQMLKYGGAIGGVILLLSVVGVGLIIEHLITIRRDQIVPPDLLGHIEQLFEEEEYEEVMTLCETQPTFLTNVLAAGLPKIGTGYENIERSMGEVGDLESTKLNQKISYINLIANVSPMLGLFGTVSGMIGAFNTIATSKTQPTPAELAGGIQQALVTTFLGLLVAIPMLVAYFFFRARVQRIILEVGSITEELMERFREE